MNRRGFLKGLVAAGTIAAAPALAREGILMPVKQVVVPERKVKIGKGVYWDLFAYEEHHVDISPGMKWQVIENDIDGNLSRQYSFTSKESIVKDPEISWWRDGKDRVVGIDGVETVREEGYYDLSGPMVYDVNEQIPWADTVKSINIEEQYYLDGSAMLIDFPEVLVDQRNKLVEEFFKDLTLYGQAAVDIQAVKSVRLSEEDLAELKKRYPST